MQIIGPKNLKVEKLRCSLFKTAPRELDGRLLHSIKEKGIKEPLLITPVNGKSSKTAGEYEVVDGFRRLSAAKKLNLKEVPVLIIEDATGKELQEIALVRNSLHKSFSSIETALYIRKLKRIYGYKNTELASLLGVQKSYITELLRIFKLGDWAIRKLKQKRGFTVSHARILSRCEELCKNKEKLEQIVRKIMDERWSRKRLCYELRKMGYLEDSDPCINVNGLFNRLNTILNEGSGRFSKTLKLRFDNLWELRTKLMQASRLLSRFAEFLPEEKR